MYYIITFTCVHIILIYEWSVCVNSFLSWENHTLYWESDVICWCIIIFIPTYLFACNYARSSALSQMRLYIGIVYEHITVYQVYSISLSMKILQYIKYTVYQFTNSITFKPSHVQIVAHSTNVIHVFFIHTI